MGRTILADVKLYSTCPQSKGLEGAEYRQRVTEAARWSENAGMHGMLVYTDNGIVDPWLVSTLVIRATSRLVPLVAVQPIYMHPYAVAKIVTSIAYLSERRLELNLLAGGFRNDLLALGDPTPHDDRYRRTTEYGMLIRRLCDGESVTSAGTYYAVENLVLRPPVPPALRPRLMISGSSPAGIAAARELGATAVRYPQPPSEETVPEPGLEHGVRLGIIARESADDAWSAAYERFPADRRGQIAHGLAMKVSDSSWHEQLGARDDGASEQHPYWLEPFRNSQSFCPYLVGSYDRVARELQEYMARGFGTFVLDIPPSGSDLGHTTRVFDLARKRGPA